MLYKHIYPLSSSLTISRACPRSFLPLHLVWSSTSRLVSGKPIEKNVSLPLSPNFLSPVSKRLFFSDSFSENLALTSFTINPFVLVGHLDC